MPSDLSLTPELFAKYLAGQDALVRELASARTARERIGPKPTPFRTLLRHVGDEYRVPNGVIRHIGISTPAFFQTVFTLVDSTSGQLLYTGNTAAGSLLKPDQLEPGTLQGSKVLQSLAVSAGGVSSYTLPNPPALDNSSIYCAVIVATSLAAFSGQNGGGMPLLMSDYTDNPNIEVYLSAPSTGNFTSIQPKTACSAILMELSCDGNNAASPPGGGLENRQALHAQGGAHAYPVIPTTQSLPFTLYAHGNQFGVDYGHDQSPYTLIAAPSGGGGFASVSYAQAGNVAPLPTTGWDGQLGGFTLNDFVKYYHPDVVISVSSMQATSQPVFIPFQGGIRLASFTGLPLSLTGPNDYPIIVCGETST